MAKIRIGFSSDFVLENSEVGIGTTNPTAKLQVAGTLKSDFDIAGVTTLTSYGGFVPQKQSVSTASTIGFSTTGIGTAVSVNEKETGFISLVGEFNTVSEDIVVDDGKILDVSTIRNIGVTTLGTQSVYVPNNTTVSVGTLEHVSIGTHFSVPNSGISSRPQDPKEGMVRFNDDLNTLEFYNGVEWRQFTVTGASGRGVFGGGYISPSALNASTIDYINISSIGNAQDFGNLTTARWGVTSCSSSTRGIFAGGFFQSPAPTGTNHNIIDYITIASQGNAIDFGDRTVNMRASASCSSSTRGLFAGGYSPTYTNVIDYIQISTIGNALDFGDMTFSGAYKSGCSSPTRGIFSGGQETTPSLIYRSTIDFVTLSSTGNALLFGDLTVRGTGSGSFSSSVRGVIGGRYAPTTNAIDYITIASTGNAIYFGDLTTARFVSGACSNSIRGVWGGGAMNNRNIIDYVTIMSTGNAIDFGDLTVGRGYLSACSDSHGGLGGF